MLVFLNKTNTVILMCVPKKKKQAATKILWLLENVTLSKLGVTAVEDAAWAVGVCLWN